MSNRLTQISAAIKTTIMYSRKSDFLFWIISRKYFRLSWIRSNCTNHRHAYALTFSQHPCGRRANAQADFSSGLKNSPHAWNSAEEL